MSSSVLHTQVPPPSTASFPRQPESPVPPTTANPESLSSPPPRCYSHGVAATQWVPHDDTYGKLSVRFVLRLLMLCLVALAVGFGLSYYALTDGRLFGAVQLGPWTTWPDIGSPTPNPYSRSHIAREGALQLGRSEGLQFVATTDSAGAPLDLSCSYRIEGHVPVSTFWTLLAVDAGWRDLAAPGTAQALRSSEVVRTTEGALLIHVGTQLRPDTWLELAGSGPFSLVMTLYDTTALSGFSSTDMIMPSITAEGCA